MGGLSRHTVAQNMQFDSAQQLRLRDIYGTDLAPTQTRKSAGSARTQRHTGAGGAGMHHTWKRRRASGRA